MPSASQMPKMDLQLQLHSDIPNIFQSLVSDSVVCGIVYSFAFTVL